MLGFLRSGNKRTKAIWWALTIITVVTFIGGFIVMGGMGTDSGQVARSAGTYGKVAGEPVTRDMYLTALEQARMNFRQQYGADPQDRDLKMVEQQAWRGVVSNLLLAAQAKQAGLKASDSEVITSLRTNPPAMLMQSPTFQTNGQFDYQKYLAAMADPENNWAPFEDMARSALPLRKLQERLLASIKMSEPELRESFRNQTERMSATVLTVPPADTGSSPGGPEVLQRMYDKYQDRLAAPARTMLEVLTVPKQLGEEETRIAMQQARDLAGRARGGEDFARLARDFSEGPNAQRGGVIDRSFQPAELAPIAGQQGFAPGTIYDPYTEGSRITIFKVLDPARDSVGTAPAPGSLRLAQIVLRIRPSSEAMRAQYENVMKIAGRAKSIGLSKAATEKGLATTRTNYFNVENEPPQLFQTPEAVDWGVAARLNDVSPVFEGPDVFAVAQVVEQLPAGPPALKSIEDQLKQVADVERRIELAKPRADRAAAALASGRGLKEVAAEMGLQATELTFTRSQPPPSLMGAPEVQGALWAAPVGKVIGPIQTTLGHVFARKDGVTPADTSAFNDQIKGQLTDQILQQRQRVFFDSYLTKLRQGTRIEDFRQSGGEN